MAMNQFDVPYASVALTGTTVKTVAGVKASTNVALKLLEAAISFDGATSTATPAVVDFGRCTFATNSPGTASTSLTLGNTKRDPGRAETIQATAGFTWTSEPTVITPQHSKDIGQFNGIYHFIHPMASPIIIAGGAGFVIRVTPTATVNVTGHMTCEE
jgi:hypothetical protein